MADAELNRKHGISLADEEDLETLGAIDRGARDADAGRLTPIEKVEELLHHSEA